MSHYLLSVHSAAGEGGGGGEPPSPEEMQGFMQRIIALEAEMDERGAFVFGGRLTEPDAAAVVRSTETGQVIRLLPSKDQPVDAMAFSEDGELLAVSTQKALCQHFENVILVWDRL